MPLRDDILTPIPGDNPGGLDLRYAPIYDKIKEARSEEEDLPQGDFKYERKVADHAQVIRLTQETIAKQSKDLQLAVWLSESLLKKHGFGPFREGLDLCRNLIESFWDDLYPALEDGDAELRAAPLDLIATKFDVLIKSVPLCLGGYSFYKYKESRAVGYEDQAKEKDKKAARDAAIKSGKLTPEAFDKSFGETPKDFYAQTEKSIDGCRDAIEALNSACSNKFASDVAPSFGKVRSAFEEVRQVVHSLLQKKREIEPDPVVEEPPPTPAAETAALGQETGASESVAAATTGLIAAPGSATTMVFQTAAEPADRRDAVAQIIAAAAFLRKREPANPAPYLMLRGLRWGELRAALDGRDPTQLEAPPTDVRRQVKQLALAEKWKDLIEVAESVMALPCSRAWIDLQRFVVDACVALEYPLIASAIRSELRALARDCPQILDLTLMDDTPAANAETRTWLQQLMEEPQEATPNPRLGRPLTLDGESSAGWQQKFVDSFQLATQALRSGQEQKAFEIMHAEVQRQRSGRGRFEKRLQFVQLCVATGKEAIMQPMLDDLFAAVDNHKLEEWEDREKLAASLATILRASKKIQGDAKEKQKLFERICRLDPVQALAI